MAGLFGTLWLQGGRVAGVTLGGVPSDFAARRHPRYRMLIMVAAYALAAPLLTTFAWSGAWMAIAISVFGFSMLVGMGYVNAQPLLCELLPEHLRSTAIGLMNMMSCFIGGAGVLVAGALKSSFGLHNAFASLGVIQASVAMMLFVTFFTLLPRDLRKVQSLRAATDPTSSPPESAAAGAERSRR
jgi:MFS family permease